MIFDDMRYFRFRSSWFKAMRLNSRCYSLYVSINTAWSTLLSIIFSDNYCIWYSLLAILTIQMNLSLWLWSAFAEWTFSKLDVSTWSIVVPLFISSSLEFSTPYWLRFLLTFDFLYLSFFYYFSSLVFSFRVFNLRCRLQQNSALSMGSKALYFILRVSFLNYPYI